MLDSNEVCVWHKQLKWLIELDRCLDDKDYFFKHYWEVKL